MNKRLDRMYGEPTADMWTAGPRGIIGMILAGIAWIAMGAFTTYAAFAY